MANLYDERGRQIMHGDVLKVFHFTGARRKRHYMYKQARETVMLGSSDPKPFLKISHLNIADEHYHEREDGRTLRGYEIVQSGSDELERRARVSDWIARTAAEEDSTGHAICICRHGPRPHEDWHVR